jgi:two-component system sensor histidine kinase/response regulator
VDDTPENLDVLNGLLSDFKRKVAINGEIALKIAFSPNPPDLILLDIMMPVMDGYEVCRRIRQNEKTKDIPVIFLTAKTSKEDIIKGFEVGGQDYVTKPFDHIELMKRVETQLELKHQREELKKMNELLDQKVKERTRELEEANEKLQAALKKLQGLDVAKTNFLRLVSHELRTPLNGIMGSAYFLKEIVEDPNMIEFIDMLKVSAERLDHLSNMALEITDMQASGKLTTDEMVNVEELINKVIQELAKSGVLSHRVDKSQLIPFEFKGDNERIFKAIKEVITNANKFSIPGADIVLRSAIEDDKKWLCIENESDFIGENQLYEMRTPFGLAKSHSDGNTGLGLAFVNTVMVYHGGEMKIDYKDGKIKVCLIFKNS